MPWMVRMRFYSFKPDLVLSGNRAEVHLMAVMWSHLL